MSNVYQNIDKIDEVKSYEDFDSPKSTEDVKFESEKKYEYNDKLTGDYNATSDSYSSCKENNNESHDELLEDLKWWCNPTRKSERIKNGNDVTSNTSKGNQKQQNKNTS